MAPKRRPFFLIICLLHLLPEVRLDTNFTAAWDEPINANTTLPVGNDESSTASTINDAAEHASVDYAYLLWVKRILNKYILGWTTFVAELLGIAGNVLNVIVLTNEKMQKQSSSNVYLGAIAVTDLIHLAFGIPYAVGYSFGITSMYTLTGFYANYMCYTLGLSVGIIVSAKWITVALTIERFIAVSFPFLAQRICSPSRARRIIPVICFFAFAVNFPSFVRFSCKNVQVHNTTITVAGISEFTQSTTGNKMFHLSLLIFSNIIPFSLLIIFNFLLIWRLRQMSQARKSLSTTVNSTDNQNTKITLVVVGIVVLFLVCNFLGALTNILGTAYGAAFYETLSSQIVMRVSNLMINCNPAMNFFMYSAISNDFRQTLKQILRRGEPEGESQTGITSLSNKSSSVCK